MEDRQEINEGTLMQLKLILILSLYPDEIAPALAYVVSGDENALRGLVKKQEEKMTLTNNVIGFLGVPEAFNFFKVFRQMGLENDQIVRLNLILHFRNSVLLSYHLYLCHNDTEALQEANTLLKRAAP